MVGGPMGGEESIEGVLENKEPVLPLPSLPSGDGERSGEAGGSGGGGGSEAAGRVACDRNLGGIIETEFRCLYSWEAIEES
jgi:hypothetical protein